MAERHLKSNLQLISLPIYLKGRLLLYYWLPPLSEKKKKSKKVKIFNAQTILPFICFDLLILSVCTLHVALKCGGKGGMAH